MLNVLYRSQKNYFSFAVEIDLLTQEIVPPLLKREITPPLCHTTSQVNLVDSSAFVLRDTLKIVFLC
jgi:hypothetical protein